MPTAEDRARIAARYPGGRRSTPIIVAAGLVATLLGLTWMMWAALDAANPKLVAMVESFEIPSDQEITAVLRVQRSDPNMSGTCLVVAQAVSYERVGELELEIEPAAEALTLEEVSIKTVKRATSISVVSCEAD